MNLVSKFVAPAFLILLPLIIYLPAVTHEYGLRDDYSLLREAHEEPGKTINFTGSHGRPLYGLLLESGFKPVKFVSQLGYLRSLSIVLLSWLALGIWRVLLSVGWGNMGAFIVATLVICLPSSQILTCWSIGWPWGFSLLLSLAAFQTAECSIDYQSGLKQISLSGIATLAYAFAASIYQSNALFSIPLLAATLLSPANQKKTGATIRHIIIHLVVLCLGLTLYYFTLRWLFGQHLLTASARLTFETKIISKLQWFFMYPLPNAMAFFTLRDDFNFGAVFFWISMVVVGSTIALSAWIERDGAKSVSWLICIFVLPFIAHGISLVAAERVIGYRTCFPITTLFVVLFITSLRNIAKLFVISSVHYFSLPVLLFFCMYQAWTQAFHLLVLPQEHEWQLIRNTVEQMHSKSVVRTYIIEPNLVDRSTERVFRDEFGSLSTDSDWTPKEMFKDAIKQRFPSGLPHGMSVSLIYSKVVPDKAIHYDYVVDMRNLKHWR